MLNENETIHSATMSYPDTNYCQKGLTCNMSQLSVESNKSSDPAYDVPSRDAGKESPSKSIADKGSIYNLLWPQPKTVNELKNFTGPFIAGKELFISIIQVISTVRLMLLLRHPEDLLNLKLLKVSFVLLNLC